MHTRVKMTIQDYFKRDGIRSPIVHRANGKNADIKTEGNSFSQALVEAQSSNDSQFEQMGLSIRDYVARPVQAIRSLQSYPGISTAKRWNSANVETDRRLEASPKKNSVPLHQEDDISQEVALSEKDVILKSIDEAANRYNLSPALIRAVVQAESDYQVRAVSPAGAQGLMQLMPDTAKALGVQDPFDIEQNIDGGAKYIRKMLDQFGGDIKTALSAYNAGPGTVAKYNGDVPYSETRNYVERVMRFSNQFSS